MSFLIKKCLIVIAVSFVYLSTSESMPVSPEDQKPILGFMQHVILTKKFQCNKPQLRSYRIKDLLSNEQRGIKEMITPSFTVVQRCDEGAGCCEDNTVCVPNPNNITYNRVTVKLFDSVELYSDSKERILEIEEHGSCMCKLKSDKSSWPVKPPAMLLLD